MTEVVIVAAKRTPMGGFQGALSALSAVELGAEALKACIAQSGIEPNTVEEVYMGCVLPAGLKQAPARQAALAAGLELHTGCTTVNKVCGSGMKALMIAADQIKAGNASVLLAGGMESMSNAPYMLDKARAGMRMGHQSVYDHMFLDGLEDAYDGKAMGAHAQRTADEQGITREQMDAYAIESLRRAQVAIAEGHFVDEITPIVIADRRGETVVSIDEQPGLAKPDKIPQLRPAFAKDGTITAANASSISDGAAALLVMSREQADAMGIKPLAIVRSYAGHAQSPAEFTTAPIGAMQNALAKANWQASDIELAEINEAFAMVAMLGMQDMGLAHNITNISGGATALGHPLGCSGARILVTLLHGMRRLNKKRGLAALCIGGGEGTAVCLELVD